MGPFKNFERPGAGRTAPLLFTQVQGHPVAVHEVAHFPLTQKDIRHAGVLGNEKAVSIPVGLNPTHDDLGRRGKAIMPRGRS